MHKSLCYSTKIINEKSINLDDILNQNGHEAGWVEETEKHLLTKNLFNKGVIFQFLNGGNKTTIRRQSLNIL